MKRQKRSVSPGPDVLDRIRLEAEACLARGRRHSRLKPYLSALTIVLEAHDGSDPCLQELSGQVGPDRRPEPALVHELGLQYRKVNDLVAALEQEGLPLDTERLPDIMKRLLIAEGWPRREAARLVDAHPGHLLTDEVPEGAARQAARRADRVLSARKKELAAAERDLARWEQWTPTASNHREFAESTKRDNIRAASAKVAELKRSATKRRRRG